MYSMITGSADASGSGDKFGLYFTTGLFIVAMLFLLGVGSFIFYYGATKAQNGGTWTPGEYYAMGSGLFISALALALIKFVKPDSNDDDGSTIEH